MRGFMNVFSLGMDDLADKFEAVGSTPLFKIMPMPMKSSARS